MLNAYVHSVGCVVLGVYEVLEHRIGSPLAANNPKAQQLTTTESLPMVHQMNTVVYNEKLQKRSGQEQLQ